jgi:hypothetical protein
VILTSFPAILELRTRHDNAGRSDQRRLAFHSLDEAARYLRSRSGDTDFNARLRACLAGELHLHGHHDTDALHCYVATRLASGELQLLEHARYIGGAYNPEAATAAPPPAAARPPAPKPAKAPAPAPAAAPVEAGIYDDADQRAQAMVLTQAAKDGTPFCEICEREKQRRAAAEAQPA